MKRFSNQTIWRILILVCFVVAHGVVVFGQEWVMDEIAEESVGGPFSGILGAILTLGLIWLLGTIFGGEKDDRSMKQSGNYKAETTKPISNQIKTAREEKAEGVREKSIQEKNQIVIGHEISNAKTAVDLGLSVYWADSNLLTKSETDKDSKYSWGNINRQTSFGYAGCYLNGKRGVELEKIIGNEDQCISGIEEYDPARHLWGNGWRMPQKFEIKELIEKCAWQWTSKNGVNGYIITGCNGNKIFLPVTGERIVNDEKSKNSGCYWSGCGCGCGLGDDAYYLYFDAENIVLMDSGKRFHGMVIRPVWSLKDYTNEKDGFILSLFGAKLIKCNDVEDCKIPYGVKVVSRGAFKNAQRIRSLYIPDTVEEIEELAFEGLHIESVHIPKSIKRWGKRVFSMCVKLKYIYIEEGLPLLGRGMFMYCDSIEDIIIPESIKSLPKATFYGCKSLKYVQLPSKLVNIGEMAFCWCEKLKSIELPGSLIGIRNETFDGCLSLSNVTLSEGITVISSHSFTNCYELHMVKIPATLQHIDTDAFYGCDDLVLEVPKGTKAHYQEMNLDGISEIKEYESSLPNNIDELKIKSEEFIKFQDLMREQEIQKYYYEVTRGI